MAALKPGEWLLGDGWDEGKLAERRYVTAADLDPVSAHNPVWLTHTTGHYGVANSAALRAGEDFRRLQGPARGHDRPRRRRRPHRGIEGVGTERGCRSDPAADGSAAARRNSQEHRRSASRGHDRGQGPGDRPARVGCISRAAARGQVVGARVRIVVRGQHSGLGAGGAGGDTEAHPGRRSRWGDGRLAVLRREDIHGRQRRRAHRVDVRSYGTRTPPASTTAISAIRPTDPAVYRQMVRLFHQAGVHVGTHAVGDRAIDWVVDTYAQVLAETPTMSLRHSIIHANIPSDHAIKTMAELQTRYDAGYPEAQAPFMWWIGDTYAGNFGPERALRLVPLNTYVKMGIRWGGGSDYPVTPLAARYGLWASVERETLKGTYGAHPFGTAESVDIHSALRSYTVWGARQLFLEDRIGSLEIGKEADIAVWDRDMYTIPSAQLRNLKCTMTLFNGKVVYDSKHP